MKSTAAFIGAFLFCPCHFPFIAIAVLLGLGYGAYLGPYAWPVWAFSTLAFLALSWIGLKRWRQERASRATPAAVAGASTAACEACAPERAT